MSDFLSNLQRWAQTQSPMDPNAWQKAPSSGNLLGNINQMQQPGQPAPNPWVNGSGGMSSPYDPKPPGINPPAPGMLGPPTPPAQAQIPQQPQQAQGGQGGSGKGGSNGGSISGTVAKLLMM